MGRIINEKEMILIVDFGSQYSQLIARRVREHHVFCQILPHTISTDEIKKLSPKGIILSGGPASVYQNGVPQLNKEVLGLSIPILGICYGMQIIAHLLGGEVSQANEREYGKTTLFIDDNRDLFNNLPPQLVCWMSHADSVSRLPLQFRRLAHTQNTPIASMANRLKKIWGIQFHPEVVHTPKGREILGNFLFKICNCKGNWTMKSFIKSSVAEIRHIVGERKVVCGLSGGVDSSVTAILISRAIGNNLSCIFVDNGLLRKGEAEQVKKTFGDNFHLDLHCVNAEKRFLNRLKNIVDPEEKRKVIGNEFIKVFEETAAEIGNISYLAQGTLYPDVIESHSPFGGPSAIIKTHHNVGGLPRQMRLGLIEPLKFLFKDEVRILGRELGLPEELISRHPFPGPGLAVRALGKVTKERLDILREIDERVIEEIKRAGLYQDIWQAFAVLLPVRSVGVMGDERTYKNVVALRAVTSSDGMTADWAHIPYEVLERISNRIINEVEGVNRVVYDISSKPPSTIEWE